MKLKLVRDPSTDQCTLGKLYVDDVFECYTLEDIVRPRKIFGQTAIPTGTYEVTITYSPHFNRDLPLLNDVPGYSGVRIHPGNTAVDTEGCILVGQGETKNAITSSRLAFDALFAKMQDADDIELVIE